ncbi:hypothetical protein ELH93_28505 (plasmid) [Rhizobium leguminosarum]|uniref:hypothetical protein n=1 Tax=Rhizobium leguminosarum TaxID=384 RepID=UPI00102FED56|nr:hypothetical protein [Rhizobium leguminosarum]TAY27671.1 hypothetical protein ELH93_28505 [Rhizobium leguminosarum]
MTMTRTDMHQSMKRQVTPLGVTLFGIHFNSDALQRLRMKGTFPKNVTVLVSADDIRMVGVEFSGGPTLQLSSRALDTCDEPVSLEGWVAAYKAVKGFCDAGVRDDG